MVSARNNRMCRRRGFTLVEVAVLLAILSFVAVNFIVARDETQKLGAEVRTAKTMKKIREAVQHFYIQNGYLPCPAYLDASAGSSPTTYATSVRGNQSASPCVDPASITSTRLLGSYTAASGLPVTYDHNVIGGYIPVRSLGLDTADMLDGWSNRILYVVDRRWTYTSGCKRSDIRVVSDIDTTKSLADNISAYTHAKPPYLLLSMGQDKVGAFSAGYASSNQRRANTGAFQTVWQNVNNGLADNGATSFDEAWDSTSLTQRKFTRMFVRPLQNANNQHFDDIITYDTIPAGGKPAYYGTPVNYVIAEAPGLWLDAADSCSTLPNIDCSGTIADGNRVRCWLDKSSNMWDFINADADATKSPTYNANWFGTGISTPALNVVNFTGTNFLTPSNLNTLNFVPGISEWTMFFVTQGNATGQSTIVSKGAPNSRQFAVVKDANNVDFWTKSATPSTLNSQLPIGNLGVDINDNRMPSQFSTVMTTTAASIVAEGITAATDTDIGTDTTPNQYAVLGGELDGTNLTRGFTDGIGEVLAYPKVLSAADRRSIECYLMEKWRAVPKSFLPANLDSSNPDADLVLWLSGFCPNQLGKVSSIVTWEDWAPRRTGGSAKAVGYDATQGSWGSPNGFPSWLSSASGSTGITYDTTVFGGRGGVPFGGSYLGTTSAEISATTSATALGVQPGVTTAGAGGTTGDFTILMVLDIRANSTGTTLGGEAIAGAVRDGAGGGYIIGKSHETTANRQWEISYEASPATGNPGFDIWLGGVKQHFDYSATGPFVAALVVDTTATNTVTVKMYLNNTNTTASTVTGLTVISATTSPSKVSIGARPGCTFGTGSSTQAACTRDSTTPYPAYFPAAPLPSPNPLKGIIGEIAFFKDDLSDTAVRNAMCNTSYGLGARWGITVANCP